jgi:acyl carrier protein
MNLGKRFKFRSRADSESHQAGMLWAIRFYPESQRGVAAKVARIFKEQLNVTFDQLSPATRLVADLRLDDLEPVEALMALEEEFDLTISERAFEHLDEPTVADIIAYCLKHATNLD